VRQGDIDATDDHADTPGAVGSDYESLPIMSINGPNFPKPDFGTRTGQ